MEKRILQILESQEYSGTIDVSKDTEIFIPVNPSKRGYHATFKWNCIKGEGKVGMYASQDTNLKALMTDGGDTELELTIDTESGEDFIADYAGHISAYLGILTSGFTSGNVNFQIYFK